MRRLSGQFVLLMAAAVVITMPGVAPAADGISVPVTPRSRAHPLKEIWSGSRFTSEAVRAIQADRNTDIAKGRLEWAGGRWQRREGERGKSCADCHNNPAFSMRSAGTRYPVYFKPWKKIMSLAQRINHCRSTYMRASPWPEGSPEILAMTALVRRQSRRMPVTPRPEGHARTFFTKGEALYHRRIGQRDMSCAQCHETYQGRRLGAQVLSQGQASGFPVISLRTRALKSLHQQFQQCFRRVRAEPLREGSDAYVNLELYLVWRGQGLPVEAPAVRE